MDFIKLFFSTYTIPTKKWSTLGPCAVLIADLDRQIDRLGGRQTDRLGGRQTDRKADRQAGRQADRQTGRQGDRQTDR